jgi:hypothetical protein
MSHRIQADFQELWETEPATRLRLTFQDEMRIQE